MSKEINFHDFLSAMRQLHEVTLEQTCEGLCSISMMKRIESGERLPEKQMRDRILSRMGVPLEGYEDYLSTEEYEQWVLRQKLLGSIEQKHISEAEQYLVAYKVFKIQNVVEAQYCEAMELMILQMKNAPLEKQQDVIKRAVKLTMPKIENGLSEKMLLSEQELNLLIEYARLKEFKGNPEEEFDWRCKQYKDILNYIMHSHLDDLCRAKVYPKGAYYLCETILHNCRTTEDIELGINVCNEAIELLRDSRKLYYFIELIEVLEKLIEEKIIFLQKSNKREEVKALQRSFEEKIKWRDVMMELYIEYNVIPYIENFCHVYWETESYCIGDVIRTRRQMFGMTKEQLCEGICSVKTLTRIELKKAKTQMSIVRELFERLGLCAEYIRARVITKDYEVLRLAERCAWYENNYRMDEFIQCLKELEQRLDMDIPQNKQFIMSSYYLLNLKINKLSNNEFIESMKSIIEYTIPFEYVIKPVKKFLSREESILLYNIGMRIDAMQENFYMEVIREVCKQYKTDDEISMHIRKYEFLMTGLASYLGNKGKYEESDKLSTMTIEKSLIYRRGGLLAENLYNNLWNYQQRLLYKNVGAKKYKREKEFERCIILSKINKRDNLEIFFREELQKD